jgi:glycosyltransferase involved in cell wall biosynthesis
MQKKLLILVSHASFFISHRFELALNAKKAGFKVKVAFGEIDVDTKILKINKIDYLRIPINRGGINLFQEFKSIFLIWRLLKKIKPDILHLVTIKPYLYGGIAARITKVPCVVSAVSGLGSLFISKKLSAKILRIFLKPFYEFAFNHLNQIIIVQNKQDAKLLIKWGVLKKSKIKLIKGSGTKLKKITQIREPKGVIPIISFAARLLKDKGVFEFIKAANIIKKKGINANFYLAGDLDLKNPSSLSKKDLNILKKNKNIKFLGYCKNIMKLFSRSHIICLPSYREGFPKTLIEAAAAGRAIVTTNVPGCRDAIIKNKTGLIVPAKNSKKLAEALLLLIKNTKLRKSMGKAGRQLAELEYGIENIVKTHLDIYKQLLNRIK